MMAEDMIESLGHTLAATAATLGDARAAIDKGRFDLALLDVNLNGDSSMPLATQLKVAGRPFAFTTGYGSAGIDAEHADRPVLTKPYSLTDLEALIDGFCDQAGTSSITSTSDSNLG